MGSKLLILPVETIQDRINTILGSYSDTIGIYVSLNKSQKNLIEIFNKKGISTRKIFFIDCVGNEENKDTLSLSARDLQGLLMSIKELSSRIKGEKFIIIDALSTLLIYNSENKVARFIRELTKESSDKLEIIALSPKTKEEELLNKIFNFFDEVKKQ